MSFSRLLFASLLPVVAVLSVACDDPLALPPAAEPNLVDTLMLYALQGTAIAFPSGFDLPANEAVRIDRAQAFDFAFDINDAGDSQIFPTGALGLGRDSGVRLSKDPFGEIREAPEEDYTIDSSLVVGAGSVFIVRSRPTREGIVPCPFFLGALPRYGKFRVLAVDPTQRSISLEALVNVNCGYRGLLVGFPTD